MIDLNERISIDPDIRGGKPCIRETRITVYDLSLIHISEPTRPTT